MKSYRGASFLNGPSLNSQSFETFEDEDGFDNICEGWLLIKKQSKSGWKKRFCKIYVDDKIFSLYDGTSIHLDAKLVFKLDVSSTCETMNSEKSNKNFCFVLKNDSQNDIIASAYDEIDKNICMDFIQIIIDTNNGNNNNNNKKKKNSTLTQSNRSDNEKTCNNNNNNESMISSLTSWQSPTVNDMQLFDDDNGIMNGINTADSNNNNSSSTIIVKQFTTSSSSSLSPDTKKLKDIYCRKPFNKDLYIQNAYEHCTKTDLARLLENLRNDKIQTENEIKKCLIHNFNNIVHVNGEGHDFIQRNDRHNRNGKYHSRVTSFGMINTDTKDHDDIDIDKAVQNEHLKKFLNEQKEYNKLISKLGSLLDE